MAAKGKRFKAVLERGQRALGWTIALVPFEPKELGELLRLRVKGSVNGFAFRTSLFPSAGGEFYLLVNRAMQRGAGVKLGDTAEFRLEPDLEPREAELLDELSALLDEEDGLREWYDELSEYTRREIGKWVNGVKGDEARMRRAEQMAERLLAAKEGERELPPVLEAAMKRRQKARVGWAKMTPAQRRAGLLAIFYYRTPEAQARRVEKLLDEAEKRAV